MDNPVDLVPAWCPLVALESEDPYKHTHTHTRSTHYLNIQPNEIMLLMLLLMMIETMERMNAPPTNDNNRLSIDIMLSHHSYTMCMHIVRMMMLQQTAMIIQLFSNADINGGRLSFMPHSRRAYRQWKGCCCSSDGSSSTNSPQIICIDVTCCWFEFVQYDNGNVADMIRGHEHTRWIRTKRY